MEPEKLDVKKGFFESPWPAAVLLLVSVGLLWLYCLPPGLAPYRDAGEMACDVYTLGIAHQPGYPLYILAAKAASYVLPGNFAYKLNLFSVMGGLAALLTLYFTLAVRFGVLPALAAVLLFSLNFTMQTISSVSEMYALNFFFVAVLLALALSFEVSWSRSRLWLGAYLLGLAMTNRMDIVLISPALFLAAWPGLKGADLTAAARTLFGSALFWLAGFSLYLYLFVRSGADPRFDWSHPATWDTFIGVITRRSYGSTLDLISKNYAAGELFWANMKYYGLHLVQNFNITLAFAAVGLFSEFNRNRGRFLAILALFIVPGPVFLFMANMPPNPHALAVVEPNYLLPDLAVVLWVSAGLAFAARSLMAASRPALAAAAAAGLILAARQNFPGLDRRTLFNAEDWGADVMKSTPFSSSLVAKKDVQLFTLWYLQTVRGLRPDIKVVAQGLSGAKWYQDSTKLWRPELKLFNLNAGGAQEWENFNSANPGGLYSTMDSEFPKTVQALPHGLVYGFYSKEKPFDMWRLGNFRWFGGAYNDFFAKDLGTSYAQSIVSRAAWLSGKGALNAEEAGRLELAGIMDPDMPDAPLYLGFYYSGRNDWARAGGYFLRSAGVYQRLSALAEEYYSLPALKETLARSGAYAWLNYGVALEKTGDPQGAETAYARALASDPGMAEAHYNMAILYWNKDPRRVYEELQATLRIDPAHQQAAYYLARIRKQP